MSLIKRLFGLQFPKLQVQGFLRKIRAPIGVNNLPKWGVFVALWVLSIQTWTWKSSLVVVALPINV